MKCLLFGALLVILLFVFTMREGFTTTPAELIMKKEKMFVLFYNTNCTYCNEFKPTWDKVEKMYPTLMTSINVTNGADPTIKAVLDMYKITSWPTMLVIQNGAIVKPYNGDRSVQALENFVKTI